MPFDFPSSPSVGQASNGYVWNGFGWAGGPAITGPQDEQFFTTSAGQPSVDIPVPSWAQGIQIIGSCYTTANWGINCQVSTDGSTFFSGATQYAYGGSILNTGAAATSQIATTDNSGLVLAFSGDNSMNSMPNMFTAEINLVKPNAGTALFTAKSYSKAYDSTASLLYRSGFIHSYVKNATVGSALSIKAIRILPGGGTTFAAGGTIKVKWIGDPAQIPWGQAVPEPPSDGNEYVRVNGVWRLKRQDIDWSSGNYVDIPIPDFARRSTLNFFVNKAAAGLTFIGFRASLDGATFLQGASDYYYAGVFGQGSAAAFQGTTAGTFAYLCYDADNVSVGFQGTFDVEVERIPNSVFVLRGIGSAYHNTATIYQRVFNQVAYLSGGFTGNRLKAMRLFLGNSIVSTGGRVSAEWS